MKPIKPDLVIIKRKIKTFHTFLSLQRGTLQQPNRAFITKLSRGIFHPSIPLIALSVTSLGPVLSPSKSASSPSEFRSKFPYTCTFHRPRQTAAATKVFPAQNPTTTNVAEKLNP